GTTSVGYEPHHGTAAACVTRPSRPSASRSARSSCGTAGSIAIRRSPPIPGFPALVTTTIAGPPERQHRCDDDCCRGDCQNQNSDRECQLHGPPDWTWIALILPQVCTKTATSLAKLG